MSDKSSNSLAGKKCRSCEGDVPKLSADAVERLLGQVNGWLLTQDGKRIFKQWRVQDFITGMRFFEKIARLAETEGHHPDLHLCEYRQLRVEIWTHAVGGLTENDFILAAKIDEVPVELAR